MLSSYLPRVRKPLRRVSAVRPLLREDGGIAVTTALVSPQSIQWDDEALINTIKETVCKGATPSEFRMFVEVCKATGLNPFLRE